MANTKDDKTKDTKEEPIADQSNEKTEQSDAKNDEKDNKSEQSNNKSDQKDAKSEQTTDAKPEETTVPSASVGTVSSDTALNSNGSTGQDQAVNNEEVTNMADNIITKGENGKFDYSNSKTYKTVKGDTLFGVAQEHSVPMQQLRYFNGLEKGTEQLPIGIEIHIPNGYVDVPVGK